MPRSSEYLPSEFLPRKLSFSEAADPILVIDEFFDSSALPQVRDRLFKWLETTVTGNFPKKLHRHEREDVIYLYTQIEKLIEAAHIFHVNNNK